MRLTLLLLVCLQLGACSLAELPMFESSQNCTSTYDCSPGNVCHFGECIVPGGDAGSVLLVLEPSVYSGIPAQEDIQGVRDADAGAYHLVKLQSAPRVQGTVALASGETRTGTLTIQGDRSITGLTNTKLVQVGPEGFTADLLPDTYTFNFTPEASEQRPPVNWGTVEVRPEGIDNLTLPYPEDDGLTQASGTLYFTSYPAQPVIGAIVQGEHETPSGTTAYSNPTLTDEEGKFSFAFPGSVEEYRLKVSPGDNYFIPETVVIGLQTETDETVDLNLAPTTQRFSVMTISESGEPVPETTLYFQGIVQEYASTLASFEFALQTDQSAQATVNLLPGSYTVTAISPRGSEYGVFVRDICIAGANLDESLCYVSDVAEDETLELTLANKATFSGRVLSPTGDAAPGSRVTLFTRLNGQRLDAQTNTDSKGFFSLQISAVPDPEALYTLLVEPAAQLALPIHRETFTISSFEGENSVQLPQPALFVGRVTSETGLTVENVAISVYSVSIDPETPTLIGVGTSTTNGEFLIPLPAQED